MIVLLVVGAPFVAGGLLAYSGRWRSWTSSFTFRPYTIFGSLFLGLAAWFFGPALTFSGAVGAVFYVLAVASGVVMIASVFWLPDVLLPGWFRAWRAAGSRRADYARPLARPGRRRG